ncbi:MAG: NUDIX hydrolase [Candidatus Liptonbacteria bacterium]|nr:NUDIX hydrolase [Candidatus Liptonbacteria bacterium]
MNKQKPKIESEHIVYQGRIIEVVRQKVILGGEEKNFEFARRSPGARLIIPTPDKKILLTKEHRLEVGDYDYRLPGGKIFDTLAEYNDFLASGKDIADAAKRAAVKEGIEEAGIEIEDIKLFSISKLGATMVWDLFYFVVTKYKEHVHGQRLEEGENIEVISVSFDEAKEMCLDGRMREERSAAMFLRFLSSQNWKIK